MTELGDKCTVEKLQQRLCRQLAEILMRGMVDRDAVVNYEFSSRAITTKSKSLSFYTGSNRNYFAPRSRFEEIILLLMISEIIVSQNMRVSPFQTDRNSSKLFSLSNLKSVQNLLVLVLSNLRQYHLLSSIFDRGMRFANEDRHMWLQYSLSLLCENRLQPALKVLERSAALAVDNGVYSENDIIESMMMARVQIEQFGDTASSIEASQRAVVLSAGIPWLTGRCMLLLALAHSMEVRSRADYEGRRTGLLESIKRFERVAELDPHDEYVHLFCALEYAMFRDMSTARERCQRCLDINPENPVAVMLMALIFTTKRDYKSALELVINSLIDFPSHYGLLVTRLKLETKYGLVEEAMQTAKKLLCFWRDVTTGSDAPSVDEELTPVGQNGYSTVGSKSAAARHLTTKAASKEALIPTTPMFIAPLGINASCHSLVVANSFVDASDLASITGGRSMAISEHGVPPSTMTNGSTGGILSSSSQTLLSFPAFRIQADIWVELAEFFIDLDRLVDVQHCVNEACSLFPNSHHAHYLKGRLYLARAEKCKEAEKELALKLRNESKNCFLAALSLHPSHIPSMLHMGRIYLSEGKVDMAEKTLRDALSIDPFQFKVWHDLGSILSLQHRMDEANEYFSTAASLELTTPIMPFESIPARFGVG